ncbi:MAG TPA: ABC transporter substrate-binding protein, partial [Dehalococcoidia bacterium]|nr:ABC transporter substrate-binding protein [Dehalococcoidia bacterium]
VTFGRLLEVLGIDPHIDLTGLDIDFMLYSYLYSLRSYDETLVLNNLAKTFETPDPEHLEFIFTLNQGVKCHPIGPSAGAEITSEDCKQSFIRRGTSLTAPDKRFPNKIAGKATDKEALTAALETPDKYTFRFKMAEPFVPSIREMANPTWAIVPTKVLEEYRGRGLSQDAFGSGPFMLETFKGQERIVLRKHPDYFLKPNPWLDTVTYIVITETTSLYSAFKSRQHDVNGSILTQKQYADLKADTEHYFTATAPSLFYPVIHMKMKQPWDDPRVREAVDLAINRDEIIQNTQDGNGNYNGPIQWPQRKWALPQDELRTFYQYNPELARSKLAEAGYANGIDVRMKLPKVEGATFIADTAHLIKNHMEQVGIHVQEDEVELGTFIASTILPGNFEWAFFPNLPYDEPDRPLSFYHSRGVTGTGNWTNYTNPELDKLIDAQAMEFDEARRQKIILDAQHMILKEHGPQITLTGGQQYQARWNYVHDPFEIGKDPPKDVGPFGVDIWTEEA